MVFCTFIFFIAQMGDVRRRMRCFDLSRNEMEDVYSENLPSDPLLILVPSYKEEREVVFQTMMSAALVEYPARTVVLLIDDPPSPNDQVDASRLAAARALPGDLSRLFETPAMRFAEAEVRYRRRCESGAPDCAVEAGLLADLYREAADWLETQAAGFQKQTAMTHTDRLFVKEILRRPARLHRVCAAELVVTPVSVARITREYRRLACLFRVSFQSFERKRYVNLSHAPNKAMNLNSYIGLLGKHFRERLHPDGCHLERVFAGEGTLSFPDSEFIATVDADSLITSDYALRLMRVMRQPGNERIAVAQSPYTAVHGTPIPLERAAAASTDAQFFNHHGMTYFGASFWVGASALMRRSALEDIAVTAIERGFPTTIFIHDKILIEDAAATIDLLARGWRVYHDVERLSYSTTPADFGALVIQRRRWANGGLLILPKLLRYAFQRPRSIRKLLACLIRIPTLTSAAIGGIGLPILLLYPFEDDLISLWMPVAALPYYLLYGRDMIRAGYSWRDLPRVYALNLLLIPVQLGGTMQSLRQAISGQPLPFRRTPKIAGRTAVSPIYLLGAIGLATYALFCAASDAILGNYRHLVFGLFNSAVLFYAILRFIGMSAIREDLSVGLAVPLNRVGAVFAAHARLSAQASPQLPPLPFRAPDLSIRLLPKRAHRCELEHREP
jgi:cellulose synthase/poly-beta-1,6-N-acetylglucosamine synthase-like glycosyltransferase